MTRIGAALVVFGVLFGLSAAAEERPKAWSEEFRVTPSGRVVMTKKKKPRVSKRRAARGSRLCPAGRETIWLQGETLATVASSIIVTPNYICAPGG